MQANGVLGGAGGIASANPFGASPLGAAGHNGLGGPGANGFAGAVPGFAPMGNPYAAHNPLAAPTGMFGSNPLSDSAAPMMSPPSAPGYPAGAPPFGAAAPGADQHSPFANPANINPFAAGGEASPFDQPLARNPFGAAGGLDGGASARNPFAGPEVGSTIKNPAVGQPRLGAIPNGPFLDTAGAHETVLGAAFGSNPGSNGHGVNGNGHLAVGFGMSPEPGRNNGAHAGDGSANGRAAVDDAWVPPGGDEPPQMPAPTTPASPRPGAHERSAAPVGLSGRPTYVQAGDTEVAFPTYDTAMTRQRAFADDDDLGPHDATAPVSIQLPALTGAPMPASERALGTVLVEGALLSSQKLDVLRGIQHMLSMVDMDFKLGELALLFKFLSPDQLLAALLVSRGVVSPQQIAALGRIKQELGGSGMDYDLETLLIMFHILPAEELRALRKELA